MSPHESPAPVPAARCEAKAVVRVAPHHRLRIGLCGVGVAAAVLLAGCGASSSKNSATGPRSSTTTAPTTGPPTTVSSLKLTPFSDTPIVSCRVDGLIPFPSSALDGPTGAERGTSPAAKAFGVELKGSGGNILDDSGRIKIWRLATESDTDALFLGGEGPNRYSQHYEFKNGKWTWAGLSGCASTSVVQPGLDVVALNLADGQTVDANTTKVQLQVTDLACNGGMPLSTDRIVGPQVHIDASRIVITMATQKPAKVTSKSCVGAEPINVTVNLGEKLGSRQLINGNRFPFRPIS